MKNAELIIGASGFIGRNLAQHLPEAVLTFRKSPPSGCRLSYPFDLLARPPRYLSEFPIVYLCAGMNGVLTCKQQPHLSYKTNVDGTISVAEECERVGSFLVWVSSTTVMWLKEDYGVQKRTAEQYLRRMNVGIVRAGRIDNSNVDDLCRVLIEVGQDRKRCLRIWNEDEKPYEH